MIRAIIFDMDGLLIDSMLHWIEIDHIFFGKYGIKLTNEMIRYFSGRSEIENMIWVKETYKLKEKLEDLMNERVASTDEIYLEKTNLMPGVKELLPKIKKAGLKMSVATGAPRRQLKLAVDRFKWDDRFESFVSPEDVGNVGKPDPGLFLFAARSLKVDPSECVVFEDAENGVIAAKKAGMRCIAVPDSRWSFGDFSSADLLAESLNDEKIAKFLNI